MSRAIVNAQSFVGKQLACLKIIDVHGRAVNGEQLCTCLCSCGATKTIPIGRVLCGKTKSCGHLKGAIRVQLKIGDVFGSWRIIQDTSDPFLFFCRCRCGVKRLIGKRGLMEGTSRSCGCVGREKMKATATHGHARRKQRTPEFDCWTNMIARCTRKNHPQYGDYGGRGITIYEPWFDFQIFFAYIGKRPSPKYSLDRFPNNNGNYEPGNVRWATRSEQLKNTRRTKLLTFNGQTHCVTDWAEITGIDRGNITLRLRNGWSVEDALSIPVKHRDVSRRSENTF